MGSAGDGSDGLGSDVSLMSQTKKKKAIVADAEGAPPPVLASPSDPDIFWARLLGQIPSKQGELALSSLSESMVSDATRIVTDRGEAKRTANWDDDCAGFTIPLNLWSSG